MKNFGLKVKHQHEQQQAELRKQYDIEKDVVVVEKKSRVVMMWRTTLFFVSTAIRVLATITIAVFTVIGIAAVLFPAPRHELTLIFQQALSELRGYFVSF